MDALALKSQMGDWRIVRSEGLLAQAVKPDRRTICIYNFVIPDEQQRRGSYRISTTVKRGSANCSLTDLWVELDHNLEAPKAINWRDVLTNYIAFSTAYGHFSFTCEIADKTSELEQIFSGLVKNWQEATGGYSVTTRRYGHPSYQAILVLKDDVVPLLLRELQERPDWWFEALKVLTKANPVKPDASFEEAVNAWVEWGKHNNKIK